MPIKTVPSYEDYIKGIGLLKPEEQLNLIEIITNSLKTCFRTGDREKSEEISYKDARGFLKNKKFSTDRYFQMKQEEKELENR